MKRNRGDAAHTAVPERAEATILRALHFCMTADLLRPAFG